MRVAYAYSKNRIWMDGLAGRRGETETVGDLLSVSFFKPVAACTDVLYKHIY